MKYTLLHPCEVTTGLLKSREPGKTDAQHILIWRRPVAPFTFLTLIPAWISNYIHYNVSDEITYPFLNFNGATVEV